MPSDFRRKVLYIPGFDPFPPRRYRELFRRESAMQADISGYRIQTRPRRHGTGFGWLATGQFGDRSVQTEFEVLVWDDLVQASMSQGIGATYLQLLMTVHAYIFSGAFFRLMRLRRGPVLAALYPIVVLLLQLMLAGLAAWLTGVLAARVLPWAFALIPAALAGYAVLAGFRRIDHRLFAYYLMHDYAFTAMHRGAYPTALDHRVEQFAERLRDALAENPDEVLVVGHSSGAYLAASVVARYLRDKGAPPAPLSLLTLGHVVPMASFLPRARALRADLAQLATADGIFWLDVTAPGDACCFGLCDPVAVTGVAGPDQRWPLVLSAAFTQTLSDARRKELRNRWFRLHFQYLCAFDQPGDYDYFAITTGPVPLAERFAGRAPSPGRIATPAGPGLP
ncbi:hypothetical protein [Paracoccus homiensis]|uniref:Lipase (Class 3) n=1 Tax=Paracoccus homiensis TaxID=364199 RepID=A0A1I0F2Y3_9RHOB|nr:hypothetical protein [Paracoccus homiensis]SET52013.1 hypothetical protein SAMN04489858_10647 [Paracoccus homiensis]